MESGGRQPGDPIRIGLHQLFPEQRVHQRAIPRGVPGIAMFAIGGAVLLVGHWIAVQSYKKRLCVAFHSPSVSPYPLSLFLILFASSLSLERAKRRSIFRE